MGGFFTPNEGSSGAFGSGYSDPVGGLGEHSYDPETGEANSAIGKAWGGLTGKHGPTAPKLPKGFEWMGPLSQALAGGAMNNLDYTGNNAAMQTGTLGSGATAGATAGTFPGTMAAFGAGLGGLGEGISTGFQPSLSGLDALLRPGVDRSFQSGAADLREQNALTGNLSSSGVGQQLGDYRAQLENDLNRNVAGIYGAALPTSISQRGDLTRTALQLPGFNNQSIYNPASQAGSQGFQNILGAIQTAVSGVSGAPFHANQGSGGNAGTGALLASVMSKGCWVAEAIFGRDTTETEMARFYVNNLAPIEFREWYLTYGPTLAAQVNESPKLRATLRPLFMQLALAAADHMLAARETVH